MQRCFGQFECPEPVCSLVYDNVYRVEYNPPPFPLPSLSIGALRVDKKKRKWEREKENEKENASKREQTEMYVVAGNEGR